MSKHSAPFTVVVMTSLLFATMVVVVNTASNQTPNKLIRARVAGIGAPTCSSATNNFSLKNDLNITGEGTASTKNQAFERAKKNLKSKQQEIEASASTELHCGRGCTDDEVTCNWSKAVCSADEINKGNWKAICDGTANCIKTCSK